VVAAKDDAEKLLLQSRESLKPLRQIQDECTPDLLFEVVILTLERSEGEGSLYFVFVLSHMRQGTPTLILL
jgi:hypothetical protein